MAVNKGCLKKRNALCLVFGMKELIIGKDELVFG